MTTKPKWQELADWHREQAQDCWEFEGDSDFHTSAAALIEGMGKDAERYKWLRECQSIPADILLNHHNALDLAIDAALKEQTPSMKIPVIKEGWETS